MSDERVRMEFEAHELQRGQLTRWETWQAAYLAGDRNRAKRDAELLMKREGELSGFSGRNTELKAMARAILDDAGIGETK
jgi:hypothetical protein